MDELPHMSRLRLDSSVELAMEILSPSEYGNAINWIRDHFAFAFGQQIDWSHDSDAVIGNISELTEESLLQLFKFYGVEPSRWITVVWTYGDMGIKLPLYLIAQHIKDIWLPVIDDVFLFDTQDTWCMELYHEGVFSCGHYFLSM
ncbi:MAG TPA: hypothetical protein VEU97_13465 [Ktedonobacteraceae bacterium]|nr:hypothetical protein [Ktedonobacteraceae bacterium]